MKRQIQLAVFALVLMFSSGIFAPVAACGLYPQSPSVCEMYGKSKAVFVGRIVRIEELKNGDDNSNFKLTFDIQKAFFGVEKLARVVVVLDGASLEYCGFEKGKSFLVYAYKGDRGFSIDVGTRTRPVEEAQEDLDFLQALPQTPTGINISGNIKRAVKSSTEEDNSVPAAMMRLKIESTTEKSRIFYVVTDESGNYRLKGIPGGKYKISPVKPPVGFYFAPEVGFGEIDVTEKGCVSYNFTLKTENTFKGKIIDAEGNPVPNLPVEIFSINAARSKLDSRQETATTYAEGEFVAYNIAPGLYTVSINYNGPPNSTAPYPPVFYPGVGERTQAIMVEIKPGAEITDFEFKLPPRLAERVVKGVAVWSDGTPAAGAEVYLKDDEFEVCCINTSVRTDERGNFTLIGYEGRNYHIWASENKNPAPIAKTFGVSTGFSADRAKPQTIVLDKTFKEVEKVLDDSLIVNRNDESSKRSPKYMKNNIYPAVFALLIALLLGNSAPVAACWCRSESSCESTNDASAVFAGRVEKIVTNQKSGDDDFSFPTKTISFRITENFLGGARKTVKIKTGGYSGDCSGFPFEQGENYLVYASNDDKNELAAGLCGGTKPIDEAAADFEFLRKLPPGNHNGVISGSIFGYEFDSAINRYDSATLPGISLLLTGNGVNKMILTDYSGDYEVAGLKAGKYSLKVYLPEIYDLLSAGKDDSVREIELNGRGCNDASFFPAIKNTLEGTVRDLDGKPLADVEVTLLSETKRDESDTDNDDTEFTDQAGKFKFKNIFPRRYLLGINIGDGDEEKPKIFYPNTQKRADALKIDFGLGKTLSGYDLIWQPEK